MGLSLGTQSFAFLPSFSYDRQEEDAAAAAAAAERTARRRRINSLCDAIITFGILLGTHFWLSSRGANNGRPPSTQPEPRTVDKMSITTYKNADGGRDAESCAICLEEFAAGQKVRVLSPCDHTFHDACFARWISSRSKGSCPLCRATV